MTSIVTNHAAISALANLQQINNSLSVANERVGTGLRVNDAADNPTYWEMAATQRAENRTDMAIKDSLNIGRGVMQSTYAALDSARGELERLQELLVQARQTGADRAAIQTEVDSIVLRLESIAATEVAPDLNLFTADPASNDDLVYMTSLNHGTTPTVGTLTVAADDFVLIDSAGNNAGILDGTAANVITDLDGTTVSAITDANVANLDAWIGAVETALEATITGVQEAGVALSAFDSAESYLDAMIDARTRSIGYLADADMEAESTRLRALQTQQQLAIEALSIANTSSQSLLGLFR